jgi:hypothetical protein
MKPLRLVGMAFASAAFLATGEASARPFSAQDIMSVCLTTPREVEQIGAVLESLGWEKVEAESNAAMIADLRVAFVAAQFSFIRPIFGTPMGQDEWKQNWSTAQKFLNSDLPQNLATLFYHAETGAALLLTDSSKTYAKTFSCLLAVPSPVTKGASYFPKLRSPALPALSFAVVDFMHTPSSRTTMRIQSAALDPVEISKALKIETNLGAAFFSTITYPAFAVEPL